MSNTISSAAIEVPPIACLLADHLDAALAAGEDLLKLSYVPALSAVATGAEIGEARAAQRSFVEKVRTLELTLISRVLEARKRCAELSSDDSSMRPLARLFVGGTAALVDAIEDCTDSTRTDFETGDGMLAYLRTRCVVSADRLAIAEVDEIHVGEDFRVAERIVLGVLLDQIAMFLDTLDAQYQLYPADAPDSARDGVAARRPAEPQDEPQSEAA